jgi:hypothetical protein
MPSIYTSQTPVSQGSVGPANSTFAPIPGLGTLTVTDQELQFGGTAYISLFLGQAYWSAPVGVSFLNVAINELVSGTTVCQIYCTNGNQVSNMINISTTYSIAPNAQPQFSASWMVQKSPGVQILTPTTFSFSAMIFENQG